MRPALLARVLNSFRFSFRFFPERFLRKTRLECMACRNIVRQRLETIMKRETAEKLVSDLKHLDAFLARAESELGWRKQNPGLKGFLKRFIAPLPRKISLRKQFRQNSE